MKGEQRLIGLNRRPALVIATGAIVVWFMIYPVFAEPQLPDDEEVRQIIEKSLSVAEIDKEIARTQQEQNTIKSKLNDSQEELNKKEQAIDKQRKDAGKVLYSYYTGERDILLTALLSSKSLTDLLALFDYFDFIFSNDQLTLNTYTNQYKELQKTIVKLDKQSKQLIQVQQGLQSQRDRVVTLQQDVDHQLSGRSDADKLRLMIDEFNNYWKSVGLLEVKRYFSALSKAMDNIPAWIQKEKDMLTIDGFNYTITIPEDKLNAFLREQNQMFNTFSFTFKNDIVEVSGKRDGMEVKIAGHYTVENSGTILFHIDELIFNGLALPDTTKLALEKEFDLGFSPQKIVTFIKTKSVQVEDGKLVINLTISL